jgi:hypothetical protein
MAESKECRVISDTHAGIGPASQQAEAHHLVSLRSSDARGCARWKMTG